MTAEATPLVRVAALKPYEVPRADALAVIRWAQANRVTIVEALTRYLA